MAKDKLLRVTQMNAIYLDKEIVKYLQDTLRETLKYLPVSFWIVLGYVWFELFLFSTE